MVHGRVSALIKTWSRIIACHANPRRTQLRASGDLSTSGADVTIRPGTVHDSRLYQTILRPWGVGVRTVESGMYLHDHFVRAGIGGPGSDGSKLPAPYVCSDQKSARNCRSLNQARPQLRRGPIMTEWMVESARVQTTAQYVRITVTNDLEPLQGSHPLV